MPAPIPNEKRQQIIRLCHAGNSARSIAREVHVSTSTVSNVAKEIGHRFGQANAARAHEVNAAYGAERRAVTMAKFHQRCDELLDAMEGEYLVHNFGGKDNTYNEHELPEPTTEAKRAMMQAAREAMRAVLDIDRHDNKADEGLAAVDQWLRSITGADPT